MQKDWSAKISWKKVRISNGNIDLFAYYIFQNSEMLSGQRFV